MITTLLTDIAGGLTAFLPQMGKAMLDTFLGLFFTATTAAEGGVTTYTLNVLGNVALVWMIIGLSKALVGAVSAWLHLKTPVKTRTRRTVKKKA